MNEQTLNELVENSKAEAEEQTGYTLTDSHMKHIQSVIAKVAGKYVRAEQKAVKQRKVKEKNRANNKAARKSRKTNRK